MGLVSNIYSVLCKDSQLTYFSKNLYINQMLPIDLIENAIFDSTIGSIENKNVQITILNPENINILNPGDTLYINKLLLVVDSIYNNTLNCNILHNYDSSDNYNINGNILYKINHTFDWISNVFKFSNKIKYISKIESIRFLENIRIYSFLESDMTISLDTTILTIFIPKITDTDLNLVLKNMYMNLQVFSFDLVSNLFNIRNCNNYNQKTGSILDYTNLFLDINPHYSYKLLDFPIEIEINKINSKTKYEKPIYNDKIIIFVNFSTTDISVSYSPYTISSGFFYKIIS